MLYCNIICHSEAEATQEKNVQRWTEDIFNNSILDKENTIFFSILLCNDVHIKELNKTYRGKDKSTNILSFPDGEIEDGEKYLGDLVISTETMKRESDDMSIAPADHWRHIIIHGILHLLGYDHETEDDAEEMEALEIQWLDKMGIKNPYADN